MSDVKRLLGDATPLPWINDPVFSSSIVKGRGGQSTTGLIAPADAALIVYAVNRLPDYDRLVELIAPFVLDGGAVADYAEAVAIIRRLASR